MANKENDHVEIDMDAEGLEDLSATWDKPEKTQSLHQPTARKNLGPRFDAVKRSETEPVRRANFVCPCGAFKSIIKVSIAAGK